MRTLDTLKNITQTEAELFVRFSRYAVASSSTVFVVNPDNEKYLESVGFKFADYLRLRELGLLVPIDLEFSLPPTREPVQNVFTCGSTCMLIDRPEGTPKQRLKAIIYTEVGAQLLQLVDKIPAEISYLKKLASFFRYEGVLISYGRIVEWVGDGFRYDDLREIPQDVDGIR